MEIYPREGVVKEEKFPNTRKPSHRWVYGEFWNLRGQHNREKTNNNNNKTPQITRLNSTPIGEVAQMLLSVKSHRGLNREMQAACLG